MPLEVKKREGESLNALFYRFNKRIKYSGTLREVRRRRFTDRPKNKRKKQLSAIYKHKKQQELSLLKKYGADPQRKNR